MSIHRQACAFEAYAKKSKSFDEIELQINFCNKILTKSGLPFLRTVCGECALIELVTVAKVVVMCLCLNVFSRFSPEAEKLSLFAVFPLECCFLFGMEGDQAGPSDEPHSVSGHADFMVQKSAISVCRLLFMDLVRPD